MTNKKNKKELKEIKEIECRKIVDFVKVGEQFIYNGHNYTKLNEDNFCILDDFDGNYQYCIFDPITNNYDESIIRQYINSDRFFEKLGIKKDDCKIVYIAENGNEDLITLITKEQYEKYRNLMRDFYGWWWTASASSHNNKCACYIESIDSIYTADVGISNRIRPCLVLLPETPISRKGNK